MMLLKFYFILISKIRDAFFKYKNKNIIFIIYDNVKNNIVILKLFITKIKYYNNN